MDGLSTTLLDLIAEGWDPLTAQQAMARAAGEDSGCTHDAEPDTDPDTITADELGELGDPDDPPAGTT